MRATDELLGQYRSIAGLHAAMGLMQWDRQVLMPPGGGRARTEHVTRLALMEHRWWTADATQRLLERAEQESEPDSDDGAA
ncbi:MAG TPA: hypothetical protein VKT78_12575, partial [Fimbriimonadaceae bacterium]|nr:hypothetical protein [Fimbriimonadaceae bacterium]